MLNKSKGDMYQFVDFTWNPIKGKCMHDCSYCYMKRFLQSEIHLDEKDLKTDLGEGNKIFVGSSTDMFADDVKEGWILQVLEKCSEYNNHYFFQSKDVDRLMEFKEHFQELDCSLGTTIETNRLDLLAHHSEAPVFRATPHLDYISIEPIMKFDLDLFVRLIKMIGPEFVSIGADSKNHHLPEPTYEEVMELKKELEKFTVVNLKDNLKRLKK